MKRSTPFVNYAFVVLCTIAIMFPALSFILEDQGQYSDLSDQKILADTTISLTYNKISVAPFPTGKFEPDSNARPAIDSFAKLWKSAPSGIIQLDTSLVSKSDLFSISSLNSLLSIRNLSGYRASYLAIIKGIDPNSGELRSYLVLVDDKMAIIKKAANETYMNDAGRCPTICAE